MITAYGGKTVEVLNTDAEGRLVMMDALVRAGADNPKNSRSIARAVVRRGGASGSMSNRKPDTAKNACVLMTFSQISPTADGTKMSATHVARRIQGVENTDERDAMTIIAGSSCARNEMTRVTTGAFSRGTSVASSVAALAIRE